MYMATAEGPPSNTDPLYCWADQMTNAGFGSVG
jgi:hypothetical protein